jgi:hypothetical protein
MAKLVGIDDHIRALVHQPDPSSLYKKGISDISDQDDNTEDPNRQKEKIAAQR